MRCWTAWAIPSSRRWANPGSPASPAWPLDAARSAMPVSAMRGILGGRLPPRRGPHRRLQGVHPGEEASQQPVDLLRTLDLGRVAAGVDDDLLGAGQPFGHVAGEGGGDEP